MQKDGEDVSDIYLMACLWCLYLFVVFNGIGLKLAHTSNANTPANTNTPCLSKSFRDKQTLTQLSAQTLPS